MYDLRILDVCIFLYNYSDDGKRMVLDSDAVRKISTYCMHPEHKIADRGIHP